MSHNQDHPSHRCLGFRTNVVAHPSGRISKDNGDNKEFGAHPPAVWLSPDVIQDEIPWRGVSAFGYDRVWTEIAYPEALGLARAAKAIAPEDPISYIFEEFKIRRRHEKTIETFKGWAAEVKA